MIFDLDGTMVDNMMIHHKAWQSKLRNGLTQFLKRLNDHKTPMAIGSTAPKLNVDFVLKC